MSRLSLPKGIQRNRAASLLATQRGSKLGVGGFKTTALPASTKKKGFGAIAELDFTDPKTFKPKDPESEAEDCTPMTRI